MAQFSFEFYPPRTAQGKVNLINLVESLNQFQPNYFSVTFGAGGSTQDGTLTTALSVREAAACAVAPHLSCVGSRKETIRAILDEYRAQDIDRIVALRGDLPSGIGKGAGELRHAIDLVRFIREHSGDHFRIDVAAYPEFHPEATDAQADFKHFVEKVKAGANGAITQYFYNADAYLSFRDRCEREQLGIRIIPGIMPITNFQQLARFSDNCGAEIPRWIRQRLAAYEDEESLQAFGIEVVIQLCQRLIDNGVEELHFYALNKAQPCETICSALQGRNCF